MTDMQTETDRMITTPGKKDGLARLSVSLPAPLLRQLDQMVARRSLKNRSHLIAELIRHELADDSGVREKSVLSGTITLIYRTQGTRAARAIDEVQTGFVTEIISSQHVWLETGQALEVLLVQGLATRLHTLCDGLRSIRGVLQAKLVTTTALLPPLHSHSQTPVKPQRSVNTNQES